MKKALPPPEPRIAPALIPTVIRLRAACSVQDPQSAEGTIRVRRDDLKALLDAVAPED